MKRIPVVPFAVIGALAASAAAAVDISESAGVLPAALWDNGWLWDANTDVWAVPGMFFVAAGFTLVALVYRSRFRTAPAVATLTSLAAAALIGTCVWHFRTRFLSTGLLVSGVSAAVLFIGAVFTRRADGDPNIGIRTLFQSEAVRRSIAGALACVVLAASAVRIVVTRMPEDVAAEKNVQRWYQSRAARVTEETRHALSIDQAVQVIGFANYGWQPFRNALPERKALVRQFQEAGLDVQFVSRAFPLDPACNVAMRSGTMISRGGCEAAYGVRYVRDARGDEAAWAFEEWLYARATMLDPRLVHSYLEQHNLLDGFRTAYADVKREVAQDIALGKQLGVAGAPAYIVNGVRIPNTEPAMRAILSFEAERRHQGNLRLSSAAAHQPLRVP